VGKIEYSLPEDDPRNPAAVADNVGDNVGDIAGMGADLFDSYVASLIAAMLLGFSISRGELSSRFMAMNGLWTEQDAYVFASFPLILSAAGLFASLLGIYVVSKKEKSDPGKALNSGTNLATLIFIVIGAGFTAIAAYGVLGDGVSSELQGRLWLNYGSGVFGIIAGLVIGFTTDYFTDDSKKPTQRVAESSQQGHALNILTGFSYGLLSIAPPIVGIAAAMGAAYAMDGVYGVASASVGMLSIVGTIVSNDAYGPIVDNARGIAEQGGLDEEIIAICDKLDSAGNTAKAITKGFSIGAAALTVLALLYSYVVEATHFMRLNDPTVLDLGLNLLDIDVMIGALLGVMVLCIYSAVLIFAVGKNV
jgi:K(+)-stimulated pyrophosphate-energized sodium pump